MSDELNDALSCALGYADAGMKVFPVDARNHPLVRWKEAATTDRATIEGWFAKTPHTGLGWAIPEGVVAVDLDEKNNKHGLRDFQRLAGCDPRDVATPMATTPSGGLHLIYAASKPYKNVAPAIAGTGIDTRAAGGLIALPLPGNGRAWLRPLIGLDGAMRPLLPAPTWLDIALRKTPLVLAPRAALAPASSDPWAQKKAHRELERACARIVAAPCGEQDATRHRMCFYVGAFVVRGDLGYEEAYAALLEAACAMPVYRDPWRHLNSRVARSLEAGMDQPIALSKTEAWVRNFAPACVSNARRYPQGRVMADEDIAAAAAGAADPAGTADAADQGAGADGGDGTDAKNANSGPTAAGAGGIDWDALVAAALENPGAPFASDIIKELVQLKRADRVLFESVRTRLKKAGCRVTELDDLIAEESGERRDGRPPSQSDILVALAEAAELFHTPDEVAYADIEVGAHRETWPIKSQGFRRWLKRRFFEETGGAPNGEAVASAIGVIEAKAQYDTPVMEVFVRVGELDGKAYLDLCDAEWRAVEVDETGWRIVDRPTIRFRRSADMRPLPTPKTNGSVDGLRPLLNISEREEGDGDFILVIAFLLACLRPRGPYPTMVVGGEQGTAKSTRSRLLRNTVDPRHPDLRALPHDERDLAVAARNQLVLAFDNVSYLRKWLSDALCRVNSGAGFGTRELYSDADEVLFSGARPIILNGIEEIVERPDLAERSAFFTCEPISSKNRKSEKEIWASFAETHASVLGALLDAVAVGLRRFSEIRPPNLPRMADFAHWAIACEDALWKEGAFLAAYSANIAAAVESVLEASPVAVAVREMMVNLEKASKTKWSGTAGDLLGLLTDLVTERIAKSDDWPRNGRALSGRLRRASSFLRRVGINVAFTREAHTGARQIVITANIPAPRAADGGNFASPPSPPSPAGAASKKNNGLAGNKGDANRAKGDANRAEGDANWVEGDANWAEGDANRASEGGGEPGVTHWNQTEWAAAPHKGDGGDNGDAKIRTSPVREGIREQKGSENGDFEGEL